MRAAISNCSFPPAECGALSSRDACRRFPRFAAGSSLKLPKSARTTGHWLGVCHGVHRRLTRSTRSLCTSQDPNFRGRLRQTCANGQANAGCPSPFFGDFCQKERVQFVSHDGLCVGIAANSAVCKGLAIAATSEDWPFCNPEQDCTTWNEVKKVVITIYECELGDFFADLLGFFGTLMCGILSCRCCRGCCCSLDAEELQKFLGARFFKFFWWIMCEGFGFGCFWNVCHVFKQISSHALSMFRWIHRF